MTVTFSFCIICSSSGVQYPGVLKELKMNTNFVFYLGQRSMITACVFVFGRHLNTDYKVQEIPTTVFHRK